MARPVPERDDDGSVDVEAAWADIVAHWDDGAAPGVADGAQRPAAQHPELDAGDGGDQRAAEKRAAEKPRPPEPASDGQAPHRPAPSERAGEAQADDDWDVPRSRVGGERAREAAERDADAALDDERYHPPEPPPLPRGDLVSRFAWAGVLGAPLFFLVAALFWHSAPTWLVVGAVAAFIAGFVTLVVRMPDHRDEDDDGAVV